ncbi:hypothetical protein MGSAQ_001468 [marine sediment metagenome]|uniref:Uncharacterized protein n=1 Tax=marine sediment metagenome TaxID=412755 RepID=A0A1B6NUA2_9ZZZZ
MPPMPVVAMPMDAAKSAAPRLMACRRGDAAAISSTWQMPAADSMITSKAIGLVGPWRVRWR